MWVAVLGMGRMGHALAERLRPDGAATGLGDGVLADVSTVPHRLGRGSARRCPTENHVDPEFGAAMPAHVTGPHVEP
jgi:hypothetical protein